MNGRAPLPAEKNTANLRGRFWDWLAKLASAVVLAGFIPLFIWGVGVQSFMSHGERFTQIDADKMHLEIAAEMDRKLLGLPPVQFREKVDEIQRSVEANSSAIQEFRVEMSGRMAAIETLLRDQ